MAATSVNNKIDHQRLQQAAQWFALFADGEINNQEQHDFKLWLQSKNNQQAWHFVEGVSQQFANIRHSEHHNVALNALGSPEQAKLSRRNSLKLLSLLPLSALATWAGYQHTPFGSALQASFAGYVNDYATDIGQIDHINLADNSQISLNTTSAINVHYDNKLRLIDLVRGEILIDTAKDRRDFEVNTSVARLRALGTRFSVRQFNDNKIQLSVFDGRVAIYRAKNEQEHIPTPHLISTQYIVEAGEQVMISNENIQTLAPTNIKQISWQQGLLFAEETTLAKFIEQVGRYRTGYLSVAPEIAQLRIMGSFPINDTDKILAMLSNSLSIKVDKILPWWVTLEPK